MGSNTGSARQQKRAGWHDHTRTLAPHACRGAGVTPLAQVHCGEKGQKQAGSAAKIRSNARGGLPPGSEAAFQAKLFPLSAQPCWLWEGYPALTQLRSTGKMSAS